LFNLFLLSDTTAGKISGKTARQFADLYEQNLTRVFRYISYRISDDDTAQDLTSMVFEKALTRFDKYRQEKAAFSTWILTIAHNTLIDYYRSRQKEKDLKTNSAASLFVDNSSPGDEIAREEDQQKLRSCLAQLPAQDQEIISLKFGGEMTNRQIAKMLGLTESNVGVILYRAIRKLRDNFEATG
jgi:RNA polymerase sigma-70 factor (ECF subfamily)